MKEATQKKLEKQLSKLHKKTVELQEAVVSIQAMLVLSSEKPVAKKRGRKKK